jgi:hypothetical protein
MKRKLKWLAVVLAVLLLGLVVTFFLWPRDRITAESWEQIRIGMTEKVVEEVLGGPGKTLAEYQAALGEHPGVNGYDASEGAPVIDDGSGKIWISRRGFMQIHFDQRGRVFWMGYKGRSVEPNFLDRLRDWLGW